MVLAVACTGRVLVCTGCTAWYISAHTLCGIPAAQGAAATHALQRSIWCGHSRMGKGPLVRPHRLVTTTTTRTPPPDHHNHHHCTRATTLHLHMHRSYAHEKNITHFACTDATRQSRALFDLHLHRTSSEQSDFDLCPHPAFFARYRYTNMFEVGSKAPPAPSPTPPAPPSNRSKQCTCVIDSVCVRERERERERERDGERKKERARQRDRKRQRESARERERARERARERERETKKIFACA